MKGTCYGEDVNNTGDEYVLPWLEVVKSIAPSQVMIYTIDRATPDKYLVKATRLELNRILDLLKSNGISATASY